VIASDPRTSDPRTLLARPDLAASGLEGLIRADRFAAPKRLACRAPSAAVRKAPDANSEQRDQLLLGETFDVLESADGWAWGQARRDGYVGYVEQGLLAKAEAAPTHRVGALRTFGFLAPDLKSQPLGAYSLNAVVTIEGEDGGYLNAGAAGWIFRRHLEPIGVFEADPAAVAERFVGAPYLWGGRDSLGLDCSGLVQQALFACGRACPRDSDQQMQAFPHEASRDALARGDLVFWKGHVGMMLDGTRMVHANGHHLATVIEPLAEAIDRIRAAGVGEPLGFRRP
jgi:cell wall-associated NlpC family hydrolase